MRTKSDQPNSPAPAPAEAHRVPPTEEIVVTEQSGSPVEAGARGGLGALGALESPGAASLAVRVRQVEAMLRGALQPVLDEHGLTLDHWRVLAVLAEQPGLGMREVAAAAVVPAASLTRHVDRLVERGIVVRRIDPGDRRRAVVALSPHGQAYAGRLLAVEQTVAARTGGPADSAARGTPCRTPGRPRRP